MFNVVFRGVRIIKRKMMGTTRRRVRIFVAALSIVLCIALIRVPAQSTLALVPAAPWAVQTGGAVITMYYIHQRSAFSGFSSLLANSFVKEPFFKKHTAVLKLIANVVHVSACLSQFLNKRNKKNKQNKNNNICISLVKKVTEIISKNKELVNDIEKYYKNVVESRNSQWDGTFFFQCVVQVFVHEISDKCKQSFMVQNSIGGVRGSIHSSAIGGNTEGNGNGDRPYTPQERFQCHVKVNRLNECIPGLLDKIKQLRTIMQSEINQSTSSANRSQESRRKIAGLKQRLKFLQSLEDDVLSIEKDVQSLFDRDSEKTSTNNEYQKWLHANLDELLRWYSLIYEIVKIENELAHQQTNKKFEEHGKVIDKLLEMQNGPLRAIVTLQKQTAPSHNQISCIRNFQEQFIALRNLSAEVASYASTFIQSPSLDNYESFISKSKWALEQGKDKMLEYQALRKQCFPKK
jgi:uncharacterized membrane protein HdeD (DUF308 family)